MDKTLRTHVRIGEFELDLTSGRLRGSDQTIYLPEKPLRVLTILIEFEGRLVGREDIKKKLWPNDTAVDFEHGINTSIKTLRRNLGDSADQPTYIETVPRRGYRLMVPVERIAESGEPAGSEDAQAVGEIAQHAGVQTPRGELIGRTVSHYRVLGVIGGGGMGVVYRGEDLKLSRAVALKFLPEELGSDPLALERFSREARSASSLDHSNVCVIHEFGEHEGHPFIVMPLLDGQTLRDRLASVKGPLPLNETVEIAFAVAEGLRAAHEKGIIHRDIKPANIFLTSKGVCKVLDFGLAKLLEAGEMDEAMGAAASATPEHPVGLTLTRTGAAMGTAAYMSPEQVRGEKLDARTDIYSLGLVLYEMATGARAFAGETAAMVQDDILHKYAVPPADLNPGLPVDLVSIINKSLEKDRERRYSSAADLLVGLEPLRELPKRVRARRFMGKKWLIASAIAIAVFISGLFYWLSRKPVTAFHQQGTVVIADFANTTGDAVFDGSLRQALALQMGQSPYVNLLPDGKVRAALQQMEKSPGERLTHEVASEICIRTHSNVVLAGSIARVDNAYTLVLKAQSCQTGHAFEVVEADASSQKQVLPALAKAGNEMRRKLGESLASVQKFDQPLLEATTTSLAALQELSKTRTYGSPTENIPYVKRALELDPDFAWANEQLGAAYWNVGEGGLGTQYLTRAFQLRGKASPRERFQIETAYYSLATRELENGAQAAGEWAQNYPGDWSPHNNLSIVYAQLGRPEDAIREIQEVIRMTPENPGAYANLMEMAVAANKQTLAQNTYDDARKRNLDSPYLRESRYMLAFLQRNDAAMREQLQWAAGKPRTEDVLLQHQADTESYYGRVHQARETSRRAAESAKGADAMEAASQWKLRQALAETELQNLSVARRLTDEALALNDGRDNRIVAALVYARAGDAAKATSLSDGLNKEFPLDTVLQSVALPSIRAATALQQHKSFQAIELLGVSEPYELGQSTISYLYPAYLRGEAYLQIKQPERAAAEFRKLIDNPGIVGNFVSGALVHLQVARAKEMMGDKEGARKSYQTFLTLWKDADPDIPIFRQAKLEFAKLK